MAVDFQRLPPECPVPDVPPSRLLWTVVFCAISLVSVLVVFLLWPKGEPTQTPWFWTCVTVYPLGVASFVVLRRYSVHEGRRLEAIEWNQASQAYRNDVFDCASKGLTVLAATYRFSSDAAEDDFYQLLGDSAKLEPRVAPNADSSVVNARWFETLDSAGMTDHFKDDGERQHEVLTWALGAVIDALADAIRSLPDELKLRVQLMLPGIHDVDGALAVWSERWIRSGLPPVPVRISPVAQDPMYIDAWLDRLNRGLDQEARLLVGVRLNRLYEALPPDGNAETVVAVLLAPETICRSLRLSPTAMLYRPNGTRDCSVDEALSRALQWGRVGAGDITRVWQGGLDASSANAIDKAIVQAGIDTKRMGIDYMVGHVGDVAPWLAVACAVLSAAKENGPQLLITTGKGGLCFLVVKNVH